jgi:hypothetical protein
MRKNVLLDPITWAGTSDFYAIDNDELTKIVFESIELAVKQQRIIKGLIRRLKLEKHQERQQKKLIINNTSLQT